jgi:hypothetical protein
MRFPLGVIILIVVTISFYSLAVIIELPILALGGVEWSEPEEDLQYLRAFFYNPSFLDPLSCGRKSGVILVWFMSLFRFSFLCL